MRGMGGFSLIELLVVVAVTLVVAGFAIPNILQMVYNVRLSYGASDLAGLMQRARILASTQNPAAPYQIKYVAVGGKQTAFVDLNGNGALDAGEPSVAFAGTVVPAAAAPAFPYVSNSDTGNGSYDNTYTLAFTSRGLPCRYDSTTVPPQCTTPAARYFVYYLTDTRPVGANGWAAVVVTISGRTRTLRWSGTVWY